MVVSFLARGGHTEHLTMGEAETLCLGSGFVLIPFFYISSEYTMVLG